MGHAKTGISSLAQRRHLGVNYRTAWVVRNKIMQAMEERDGAYVLQGKIQVDDDYIDGERCGAKPGRGSEKVVPIVATVSINDAGHPRYVKHATMDDLPVGPATPSQAVVEQQMGEGLTTQGDRHTFHPGEIAEADLAGLIRQREHHLRRRAMQRLPMLHPPLQGSFRKSPVLSRL